MTDAPLTAAEWQVLVRLALKHFVCEPEWSAFDFVSRVLSGHARPKQ